MVTLDTWTGLVDDASIFPPRDLPLHEATAAYQARGSDAAALVGSLVLRDTDLPLVRGVSAPLSVVVTGGAGQLAGPAGLCRRLGLRLAGLEIALRDPDDPAANARRVVAALDVARGDGVLDEEVPVYVELPAHEPSHGWLAAADEVASGQLRLKFRTGGADASSFPDPATLVSWIDAALDRETPFKLTAGLHRAVRHRGDDGDEHHGFLNALVATRLLYDGTPASEVVKTLEERDGAALLAAVAPDQLAGARRWLTSFGSCSVEEPLADLRELGVLG